MAQQTDDGGQETAEGARGRRGPDREDESEGWREELKMTMEPSEEYIRFMTEATEKFRQNWFGNERGDEMCEVMLEIFTSQKMEERS